MSLGICEERQSSDRILKTYASLLRCSISATKLLQPIFSLLPGVGKFFDFGLVEPVDDGVLSWRYVYSLDLIGLLVKRLGRKTASGASALGASALGASALGASTSGALTSSASASGSSLCWKHVKW